MSFLIDCPNCGTRPVGEFRFGGPVKERPQPQATDKDWSDYIYNRPNVKGLQTEWWFHRQGCKLWFVVRRDTISNEVLEVVEDSTDE